MSGGEDQFDRLLGPDAKRPNHRVELSPDNREWVREEGADLNAIVRLARLRASYGETWQRVLEAVTDPHERAVLVAVHQVGGSATYDRIDGYTRLSRRRVRDRVADLEAAGILTRVREGTTHVQYATPGVEVLVNDALDLWFSAVE